jgi:vancomycin permeability regulator SanA
MKWFLRIFLSFLGLALSGILAVAVINKHVNSQNSGRIKNSITEIPSEDPPRVAIGFGARVWENGEPSHVLYDRVLTAVELYRAGRVKKILMSGDNPRPDYDEPTAMKKAAVELGVPEQDVVLDFAGRRTYDTCYRAREIFDVRKAVLVTQAFHQPRAIYLCDNLGVESVGMTANRRRYEGESYWSFREFFSVASAWFEINFLPFESIGGKKEPIQP